MSTLLKMQKFHPLCSRCIGMYPLQNRWTVLRYLQCYENFSECCTHLILPETALFSPTPTFAKEPKKPEQKQYLRYYTISFLHYLPPKFRFTAFPLYHTAPTQSIRRKFHRHSARYAFFSCGKLEVVYFSSSLRSSSLRTCSSSISSVVTFPVISL